MWWRRRNCNTNAVVSSDVQVAVEHIEPDVILSHVHLWKFITHIYHSHFNDCYDTGLSWALSLLFIERDCFKELLSRDGKMVLFCGNIFPNSKRHLPLLKISHLLIFKFWISNRLKSNCFINSIENNFIFFCFQVRLLVNFSVWWSSWRKCFLIKKYSFACKLWVSPDLILLLLFYIRFIW